MFHDFLDSTAVRVGADLRQLYAIGELDDYELLKKEIAESHNILNGMESRIREKLNKYKHTSQGEVGYRTQSQSLTHNAKYGVTKNEILPVMQDI